MLTGPRENFMLDDRIRGVPPGTTAFAGSSVGSKGWHPADGAMSLPVLTLDEQAFVNNRDLFFRYIRQAGAEIAPHAKTPMAPDLARALLDAGAWGTTVADIRQASVMLNAGLDRLIIANEVGGKGGAGRLAMLVAANPQADLHVFADSVAAVDAPTTPCRRCACWSRPALVEVALARSVMQTPSSTQSSAAPTAWLLPGWRPMKVLPGGRPRWRPTQLSQGCSN